MYVCMYACMHVCMFYVRMYVYVYMYKYIHTYRYKRSLVWRPLRLTLVTTVVYAKLGGKGMALAYLDI